MATLRQAARITLAALAFLSFGLGGALLSWVVLPIASCDFDRTRRHRRCQKLVQGAFVLFHDYMRLCGLVHYDPRLAPRALPEGACVLVTNHPTLIDVSALCAAYGQLYVVVKSSLFRNPLLGPLLVLCGHIQSRKNSFGTPNDVVSQAVERLQRGQRVLMFPEGSRSLATGMRRFHAGAFSAAREAGVPLVPAAIRAHPPGLRKGQAWYDIPVEPIQWSVEFLAPITIAAGSTPRDLSSTARAQIERALSVEHAS